MKRIIPAVILLSAILSCTSGPGKESAQAAAAPVVASASPAPSFKQLGEGNPLMTQRFSADPCAVSFRGRVYVYTTHDVLEKQEGGTLADNSYRTIVQLNCLSSADLVNWTDHGVIRVAGPDGLCSWAGNSWAPAIARKKVGGAERFFLYFANSANGIGVLSAPSPLGPWKDPIGRPLVDKSTKNCADVVWLFDPAVLVDRDGKGYLYFGGGVPSGQDAHPLTARAVQLGADMTSLAGAPRTIDAPYFFEDSGINEVGGVYFYSYCANWGPRGGDEAESAPNKAAIAFMTSTSPLGPWTYGGEYFMNPGLFFGVYGNNHHALVQHEGAWFLFYHSELLNRTMELPVKGYRAVHVDKVDPPSGYSLGVALGTREGPSRLRNLDPFAWTEAETMVRMAGIETEPCAEKSPEFGAANLAVAGIDPGDWTCVSGADFGAKGASSFTIMASGGAQGGAIELRLDAPDGKTIGRIGVGPSNGFSALSTKIDSVSGVHDLYLVFAGSGFRVDRWKFNK